MGHVADRWTVPGPAGKRVPGPRHGHGRRWLARWSETDGTERSKACASKDEALATLARVSVDQHQGAYVSASRVTFEAYARTWLGHQVHHRPATARHAESRLRLHVFPAFGGAPLQLVTRRDVLAMIGALALSPGAVRVVYAYTAAVFRSAVEDHLIVVSPCVRIALPEVPVRRPSPLSVDQVQAIEAGMPARLRAMVRLGAATGMRPGELRGLTVDRLTLNTGGGRVRVDRQLEQVLPGGRPVWGPPKTPASDRVVPVGASTVAALRQHLEAFPPAPGGLVFTTARGTPLSRSSLQWAWAAAVSPMALTGRTGWHDLRHHHASLLIAAGLSPRAVADRLGHSDPAETLRVYSHLWDTDEARAVDAFEAAYSSAS